MLHNTIASRHTIEQSANHKNNVALNASPTHAPTATPGGSGMFRFLYIREHEKVTSGMNDDDLFSDENNLSPGMPPSVEKSEK